MRFPAKKNAGCHKAPCDFPPRKDGILCPRWVVLGLPSPSHRVCGRTDVRMYGCTDVRTDGHVTITSQPKFLGLIGYHISLAMELRWRALPAGSAMIEITVSRRNMGRRHNLFYPFSLFYIGFITTPWHSSKRSDLKKPISHICHKVVISCKWLVLALCRQVII